ncbi:hypothetical protein [Listeria monocytogenes]|uniref:Uncharacterized protein n=1 Tax=Listeria phage LP-030-2 TaxID=1173743 RepID=R4IBI3_9CAUD|nr:hypothetical protein [Listeria monocytogenes]YP_008126719.1 hypothetical protein LP030nr2_023 [Listeria phage LP-030-2]HBM3801140.1 hypothetical protein [Listeria innocua]AFN39961.1 hypothetical protein LP030nr2_023 [Listeria phage LP-030-2]AVV12607.1 hypothetical protein CXL10_06980 [Listeria monocytogenes]AXO75375.1 hypothetical protein CYD36_05365 [Listeria monocytogenes]EAC8606744.1 hypothetical protein [Listeria monocytogenes]
MKFSKGQKVKVVDTDSVKNDKQLDETAKNIIAKSEYKGIVTKTVHEEGDKDLFFVSFYIDNERITQGFRENEVEGVE